MSRKQRNRRRVSPPNRRMRHLMMLDHREGEGLFKR